MLCLGLGKVLHFMTRLGKSFMLCLGLGTVLHVMPRLGKSSTCYD